MAFRKVTLLTILWNGYCSSSSSSSNSNSSMLMFLVVLPSITAFSFSLLPLSTTTTTTLSTTLSTTTTTITAAGFMSSSSCSTTSSRSSRRFHGTLLARRFDNYNDNNNDDDDDDDDDNFFDEEYNDDFSYQDDNRKPRPRRQRRRRRRKTPKGNLYDNIGTSVNQDDGYGIPSPFGRRDGFRLPASVSKAVLAGIFVLGIGVGVTLDSAINTNPRDLASRDAIDQAAPNSGLCATYGASAMAFDQRVFVSFNPFNVYVAQADVKPACVLRESNVVSVLRDRQLINDNEVRACKQNMNTWAFVGNLEDMPQLSCVYKSADAQNEFLDDPKLGIGEDVWDDERQKVAQGKAIKTSLTNAQKDALRKQAAINIPPGMSD